MSFLSRGRTARPEVAEKLGWADFGLPSDRLFLARWMESKEKGLLRRYGSEKNDATRHDDRDWKSENVLLQFDSQGTLKDYKVLDGAHLLSTLGDWILATGFPPVDLSQPHALAVGYPVSYFPLVTDQGQLILSGDSIELTTTGHGIPGFRMPRATLLKVSEDHRHDTEPSVMNCLLTFNDKFRAKEPQFPTANPILLRFDGQNLLLFLRYLSQTGYTFLDY